MKATTGHPSGPNPALAAWGSWPAIIMLSALALAVTFALSALTFSLTPESGLPDAGSANLPVSPQYAVVAILIQSVAFLLTLRMTLLRRSSLGWHDLGLRDPQSRMGAAVRVLSWSVAFAVAVGVADALQQALGIQAEQVLLQALRNSSFAEYIALFVGGVVVAPAAEELFFRGYLFQAVTARKGLSRGIIYSSALFAAAHVNHTVILPLAVGGAVLAYAYHRSGTLWVPMAAHSLHNAVAFAAAGSLLSGG